MTTMKYQFTGATSTGCSVRRLARVATYILFLCSMVFSFASQAAPIEIKWTSKDTSLTTVTLGPQGTFKWKNRDGTEVNLTGGSQGAKFTMADSKQKGGNVKLDPTSILKLANPGFGMNGESPIPVAGQITEGLGSFHLLLSGFNEIADVDTYFSASLVADGTDNPIDLNLFGQGDQMAFNPPGTIDYISKWKSMDTIALSNGDSLDMGNFFLLGGTQYLSDPSISAFEYSLDLSGSVPSFSSSFTSGEKYVFTDDNFGGSRFEASGQVTKYVQSIPEPPSFLLFLLGVAGLWGVRKSVAD